MTLPLSLKHPIILLFSTVSTVGIVIIVAICLGVTIICAGIGVVCFKRFELRQRLASLRLSREALYGGEVESVPLQEEAL